MKPYDEPSPADQLLERFPELVPYVLPTSKPVFRGVGTLFATGFTTLQDDLADDLTMSGGGAGGQISGDFFHAVIRERNTRFELLVVLRRGNKSFWFLQTIGSMVGDESAAVRTALGEALAQWENEAGD